MWTLEVASINSIKYLQILYVTFTVVIKLELQTQMETILNW